MRETEIQNLICHFLKDIGFFVRRINSVGIWDPRKKLFRKNKSAFSQAGMPDILACYDGNTYFIEVKSHKGKLSDLQRNTIRELQSHDQIAFVARSVTQTFETLKPYLERWQNYEPIAAKYAKLESKLNHDH